MIRYEKEIIAELNLPSIPKKEWDKKSPFDKGVAVIALEADEEAYAVCACGEDLTPRVTRVFSLEQFFGIKKVFVVPSYMVDLDDVDDMDLDEDSKRKATVLLEEAKEIENSEEPEKVTSEMDSLPEWIFPHITNRDEAEAFVRAYRKENKIKGKIPQTEENLKTYLYVMYTNKKNKK